VKQQSTFNQNIIFRLLYATDGILFLLFPLSQVLWSILIVFN